MPCVSITRLRVPSWRYLPGSLIQSFRAAGRAKAAAGNVVMSGPSTTVLGPGYRLTLEDVPDEADVEVLPRALEAYTKADGRSTRPGSRSLSSRGTGQRLSPAS